MVDNSEIVPVKKASKLKTILFVLIVAALLFFLVATLQALRGSGEDTMPKVAPTTTELTPDDVKQDAGPNGDTQPSPTGTAPEGNNSLLSQ